MSRRFDCSEPTERAAGLRAAISALKRGDLVVLPTDTVYGLAADAFTPAAVAELLATKGRGRDMPVPVLVGSWRTVDGLVNDVDARLRELIQAFWPGGLTLVVRHARSLSWDLGDSRGTVALRMPLHPVALDLLAGTGPLAVSSANASGVAPAATAREAEDQLGGSVSVYLEGGVWGDPVASSILDLTGEAPRLLREGAVTFEQLREVVPDLARES